jgi:hypothetical protein
MQGYDNWSDVEVSSRLMIVLIRRGYDSVDRKAAARFAAADSGLSAALFEAFALHTRLQSPSVRSREDGYDKMTLTRI